MVRRTALTVSRCSCRPCCASIATYNSQPSPPELPREHALVREADGLPDNTAFSCHARPRPLYMQRRTNHISRETPMSAENAARFVQQIAQDQSLKARVEAVQTADEVVRIAREAGFDLTADELKAAARRLSGREMSDQELEAVAGGGYLSSAAGAV